MAHFYATLSNPNRASAASSCGTKSGGLTARVQGWNVGVIASAYHDPATGKDCIRLYRTGGSNDPDAREIIATITEED